MGQGKKVDNRPNWAKAGHQKPVTRREFMAAGIVPFAASIALPRVALGAECPVPLQGMVPFISVHLTGGAALSSHCIPMDLGGQMLKSYNQIGMGKRPNIENEFGNVPFSGSPTAGERIGSTFLLGMRNPQTVSIATSTNVGSNAALAKTAFVNFLHRSKDDSAENKYNAGGLLQAIGIAGKSLPYLGGAPSLAGDLNHFAVLPGNQALWVQNLETIQSAASLISPSTHPLSRLNQNRRVSLARFIQRLTQSQSEVLGQTKSGREFQNTINCAGQKNIDLSQSANLDLVPPENLASIWAGAMAQGQNRATYVGKDTTGVGIAMVYNVLNGNAGSCALNLGGFDAHVGNRSTGDQLEFEAGQLVGKILKIAQTMNKPVFIYVTTDGGLGSVVSDSPGSAWTIERGLSSAAYTLFYNPKGRPQTNGFQVGAYNQGQIADGSTPTGNSPERTTQAVIANYLEIHGRIDLFDQLSIPGTLQTGDLNKVLKYTKTQI